MRLLKLKPEWHHLWWVEKHGYIWILEEVTPDRVRIRALATGFKTAADTGEVFGENGIYEFVEGPYEKDCGE